MGVIYDELRCICLKKRMLSALLSLALLICMIPAARADDGFTDVGDHWA